MRIRVSCTFVLLLFATAALAQSATPVKSPQRSVRERLLYSSNERIQWEAAQTWNAPVIANAESEPEHRPIHLEQPALAPPRIRREWLRPSAETASDINTNVEDVLNGDGSAYLSRKAQ
jgi:hypothetical protein